MTKYDAGERGTGRTTEQMKAAPQGAIFVWCNGHVSYPRNLSRGIGRGDIRIETPSYFENRWHGYCGPLVVDHATLEYLDKQQRHGYLEMMSYRSTIPLPQDAT